MTCDCGRRIRDSDATKCRRCETIDRTRQLDATRQRHPTRPATPSRRPDPTIPTIEETAAMLDNMRHQRNPPDQNLIRLRNIRKELRRG